MENTKDIEMKQLKVLSEITNCREKISALYFLYNSSILESEQQREEITGYFEQLIDLKDELNDLHNKIYDFKKSERVSAFNKNKTRINKLNQDATTAQFNFEDLSKKYRIALKDCNVLKKQYKEEFNKLVLEFNALNKQNPNDTIKSGFKVQYKHIVAIFEKIEAMVSDYNVKRNQLEQDTLKFVELFNIFSGILTKIKAVA